MPIFNSLGSNYNLSFVVRSLFAQNNKKDHELLQNFLGKKYQGEVTLVYKGREALRLVLRAINLEKSTVAICGFTCFAVYDAIIQEGYAVEYLDIEKDALHFSLETVKKHVAKNSKIKILIIQNTLGYPSDIEKIAAYCKEKNIIMIEDLAHSIGTHYTNGKEAGTIGDFTMLSFSQDKVIDGISGGALIIRNSEFRIQNSELRLKSVNRKRQMIDKLYPLFTFFIRKTYSFGIGKLFHAVLKTFNLLSNPMSDSKHIYALPSWYCSLIYQEFQKLEENLYHRKKIASIYVSSLRAERSQVPDGTWRSNLIRFNEGVIKQSTNLRFPIFVNKRQTLINYLKNYGIFISDIWYDSPIAPKKYLSRTNYNGECPESEKISLEIVNLPTHRNVSEKDAELIAAKINQWLNTDK